MKLVKQKTPRRLLITANPEADESLVGFIVRLGQLNRYETPAWIPMMSGYDPSALSNCTFLFKETHSVAPLSYLTGVNESELASLLYPPAMSTDAYECSVFGCDVPKWCLNPRRPKICPACLRNYGYCRRVWELTYVTACPEHKLLLIDECRGCEKRISWGRPGVSVCSCKYDWREASSRRVDDSELKVCRHIYPLCGLPAGDPDLRCEGSSPLDELKLGGLLSTLSFFAAQHTGKLDTKARVTHTGRRNEEVHRLLVQAISVFEDWPKKFEQFITWRRGRFVRPGNKKFNMQTGLHKEFGTFYLGLYSYLPCPQFDFLRSAFERYVTDYWDGGYASTMVSYRGVEVPEAKYVGLVEAMKRLGMAGDWVNRLISSGELKAVRRSKGKKRLVLIEANSIEALKQKYESSLGIIEASKLLGVSWPSVKDLIHHGCLAPLRGPSVDGFRTWRFSREAVRKLIEGVRQQSSKSSAMKGTEAVGFLVAIKKLTNHGLGLGCFVKLVLDGVIRPSGQTSGVGLPTFQFSEREISDYAHARRGFRHHAVAAAEILGVSREIVFSLARKGVLASQKTDKGHQTDFLFSDEDIETFNSTYALASKLAAGLRTSPGCLVGALAGPGILPVSGKNVDGGYGYVFKKTDLESLNLVSVLSTYKSRYRLHYSGIRLDTARAAEILGVDTESVQALVKNGVLVPYAPRSRRGARDAQPVFTAFAIESVKRRFAGSEHLMGAVLSGMTVMKMLGETWEQFHGRWVNSGRLKPVEIKAERKTSYYLREDVAALVLLKETTFTMGEAAKVMGTSVRKISRLTRSHKLSPVSGPTVDGHGNYLYSRSYIQKVRANVTNKIWG